MLRRSLFRSSWRAYSGLAGSTRALVAVQDPEGGHSAGRLACVALLGLAGVTGVSLAQAQDPGPAADKGFKLLSLDQRRRTFFLYEKRIRELSTQEKVFDYFASQNDSSGRIYMLPGDMMRAVVPVYPPEGSTYVRSGSLQGEPTPIAPEEESKFFKEFDINGDGCVSFDEFLLFTTLLSIPSDDIEVAFKILDTDKSGRVDAKEFGRLLEALHARAAKPHATMRHIGGSDGHVKQKPGEKPPPDAEGLMVRFFGKDGTGSITLQQFCDFVKSLREELVRLEFDYYDYANRGYMTGRDFAHSIIGCASQKYVEGYLTKVDAMPADLANAQVTLPEFHAFRKMWRKLRMLSVALEFIQSTSGRVEPKDLTYVAENILNTKLSPAQVAVLFYLFGDEQRGLNVHFMHKVMSRHHATGLNVTYSYQQTQEPRSLMDLIKGSWADK